MPKVSRDHKPRNEIAELTWQMSSEKTEGERYPCNKRAKPETNTLRIKCDLKSPRCSNCEEAQVACLVYNAGKQAEVGRLRLYG